MLNCSVPLRTRDGVPDTSLVITLVRREIAALLSKLAANSEQVQR